MSFTIPNEIDAFNSNQAEIDTKDIEILVAGVGGVTGVSAGCGVTPQGAPNMTVVVAAGTVVIGGTSYAAAGSASLALAAADVTNPRFDLVTVDTAGVAAVVTGSPSSEPVFPAIPANRVVLAAIYVQANETTILANRITDKRIIVPTSPPSSRHTVQEEGVSLADRSKLNFIGAALAAADNAGAGSTDVTLSQSPASASVVGTGRAINTTAPITGGGDLSADRTLALTTSPAGQTPVGISRVVGTTLPVAGGGDLSSDRTISLQVTPTFDGGAVAKQATTPGTAQTGNLNITGVAVEKVRDKGGQVFNVMAYGAVGDGAADDTTAISDAITAAAAVSPRGVVFFPHGTFKTTGNFDLTGKNGISIRGAGIGSTTIDLAHATNDLFKYGVGGAPGHLYNIHMSDFSITSTVARTAGWIVRGYAATGTNGSLRRARFERIDVRKQTNGFWFNQYEFVWCKGIYMMGFVGSGGIGIHAGQTEATPVRMGAGFRLEQSEIYDNDVDTGVYNFALDIGVLLEDVEGTELAHVGIGSARLNSLKIVSNNSLGCNNNFFDHVACDSNRDGHGCYLTASGSGSINRNEFTGCWFAGAGQSPVTGLPVNAMNGMRIDCPVIEIEVKGGRFYNNCGSGFYATGALATATTAIEINGCSFVGNGRSAAANNNDAIGLFVNGAGGPHVIGNADYGSNGVSLRTGASATGVTDIANYWSNGVSFGVAPLLTALNINSLVATPLAFAAGGTGNTATLTSGSVPYSDGSKLTQDNAKFFWDATNKRLGLNINASLLAQIHQIMPGTTEIARIVKAAASHTASLDEWRNSSDAVQSKIDAKGSLRTLESARVAPWIEADVAASGGTSLTDATGADITGATITFTPPSDCRVLVTAVFDCLHTTVGAVFIGELYVNGTPQGSSCQYDGKTNNARAMVPGIWTLSLSGGTSYTIKLHGKLSAATGQVDVAQTHTKFAIVGIGRF